VAAQVGVDPDEAVAALTCLEKLGLVADGGALGLWRPVPPVAGLTPLLERLRSEMARKREEADAAEAVAGQLMAEYPALDVRASSGQFRPLLGLDEVNACIAEMYMSVRNEWLGMIPGARRGEYRKIDRDILDRGVKGRLLWQDAVRVTPSTVEYARWLTEHGCQVRTVPTLPTRMLVADREIALIPLTDADNPGEGAAVVTSPGMIASLVALFDQVWATATPIDETPLLDGDTGLTAVERELLILLSQGLTDVAVGKKLGVSERTVSRMVSAVMTRLGASSRFEAGMEAMRRGWL
jgi:DNA-binding CsgD family transcriptional regulator